MAGCHHPADEGYTSAQSSSTWQPEVQLENPTADSAVRTKTGSETIGLGKAKPMSTYGLVIDKIPFEARNWKPMRNWHR